jgi:hypothetical protein
MMLRVPEIRSAFAAHQFVPVKLDAASKNFYFSRASSALELFELVTIAGAARGHQAFGSSIGISVVRGETATKGLTLLECKTPRGNEAGWFEPRSRDEAQQWLKEVAVAAPALTVKMIAEHGLNLLADTGEARAAADAYLRLGFLLERSLETSIADLRKRATTEQVNLAERLVTSSSIMKLENGEQIYIAAALSMVVFGDEVEGRSTPFDVKAPVMDRPLVWRIQLLADRLLRHHELSVK